MRFFFVVKMKLVYKEALNREINDVIYKANRNA